MMTAAFVGLLAMYGVVAYETTGLAADLFDTCPDCRHRRCRPDCPARRETP